MGDPALPPVPTDEQGRLAAQHRHEASDLLPEEANFVDGDRQWGKATHGTRSTEAPHRASFCAWA